MTKTFVDTSVYTDALLKSGDIKKSAVDAINSFDISELPVYAIKEFKAGPLKNFAWMHNKLVTTASYSLALGALHAMSRTPKRYTTSTAIEALKEAATSIAKQSPSSLGVKYGELASMDKILCDEMRATLKIIIFKAWKKRRRITTDVVCPLYCYKEVAPYEKRELIEVDPIKCDEKSECALSLILRNRINDLEKMKESIKDSDKKENINRYKVLKEICRKPKTELTEKDCKYLGDAVFALLAPSDSIILSSNISDYKPLADSLGKQVTRPQDIITK